MATAAAKAEFDAALAGKIAEHKAAKATHSNAISEHLLAKADTATKAGVLAAAIEAHRLSSIRKNEAHQAVAARHHDVSVATHSLENSKAGLKAAEAEEREATAVDSHAKDAVTVARSAHDAATIKEA